MTPAAHALHAESTINDLRVTLARVEAARDAFAADATALADWANRQSEENAELSAENERLKGEVAKWRSAASEAAGNLAELAALASEVLSDFQPPAGGYRTGIVPVETYERWLKLAEPLGIEAL